jgi:4-amino-4-deoxy-L-arabinose transferase-like glycosyltransferase
MSARLSERPHTSARRWLIAILLVSLCINCIGIRWGLPNDEGTWAADSLPPTAPMAIAKHAFWGAQWNSGWFYFKYPLGHPLVLLAAQMPYLAWLRATGQFHSPQGAYPYGFRHPDRALTVLALLTRAVSAVMGVGVVAFAYMIASALFSASSGLVAAVLVAGCSPVVFYAHTANVDVPLLFWIALAVAATLVAADRDTMGAAVLAGAAMGMALLTKEQCIGALIVVPAIWCMRRGWSNAVEDRALMRHALWAAAGFVAVTVVFGDLWWNPAGFFNRWRFLLGILPPELRDKYAPYQFQVQVPKGFSLAAERARWLKVGHVVKHALTTPVLGLCVAGAAWALWRRPRQALIPLLMIASFYVLSLRATALVQVRYTMTLLYFMLILGGCAGGALIERVRRVEGTGMRRVAGVLVVAAIGLALLPGIEIDRLLVRDPRYTAEAWLRTHVPGHARVEIYQPLTYLPRFASDMQLAQVPVEERTVTRFQERQPDFVVLSSGGRAGLTGRYVRDWEPGKPIIADVDAAKEFFDRLRGEQLGYRCVGRFRTPARWITPGINSLNPEITIFAPDHGAAAVNG